MGRLVSEHADVRMHSVESLVADVGDALEKTLPAAGDDLWEDACVPEVAMYLCKNRHLAIPDDLRARIVNAMHVPASTDASH